MNIHTHTRWAPEIRGPALASFYASSPRLVRDEQSSLYDFIDVIFMLLTGNGWAPLHLNCFACFLCHPVYKIRVPTLLITA
jgi:hypothetical protein